MRYTHALESLESLAGILSHHSASRMRAPLRRSSAGMTWADFVINFDELYVARFFDVKLWPSRGCVYGEWRGVTAGGCCNYETVRNNVQFGLTVLEPGPTDISISLQQEDSRGAKGNKNNECIIIEVRAPPTGGGRQRILDARIDRRCIRARLRECEADGGRIEC
jgi:hypothetical protein